MAAKRIFLLDGPVLTAHHWNSGRIKFEGEFSSEPAGLEALAGYLKKHKASLFFVLADIAEEGFQLEDLPYVQGPDRTALLQRRLSQYYYNTPLATTISLGRAKDGRRDEKVLFAALTRVETFTPWLDTLREAQSILAGVYSLPLVLTGFAPLLLNDSGPVLFVSLTRGGVRQTFFDKGKLHFSRLSQLATRGLDEVGRTCAADSAKIFQYLVAQRQVPRGVPLHTVVLANAGQMPDLKEFCRDTNDLSFEFIDLAAAARKLGLKDLPADSNADNLFIHCLATKTPPQQFAPAADRRFHKLWQIRFALTSAAWVILTGCLMYAGKTGLNVYEMRDTAAATQAATAADTQRYKSILEGLPKVSVTPENLRQLTGRIDALLKRSPDAEPLLVYLSLALNENPRVELSRLDWKIAERIDGGDKTAAVQGNASGWMVVEIQAQLPLGLVSDRRAQIDLIEGFAARLRDKQTDVRVLGRPFDIESDKPLKSASDKGGAQTDVPVFSLRIARPL
jgi:hypothetical protein